MVSLISKMNQANLRIPPMTSMLYFANFSNFSFTPHSIVASVLKVESNQHQNWIQQPWKPMTWYHIVFTDEFNGRLSTLTSRCHSSQDRVKLMLKSNMVNIITYETIFIYYILWIFWAASSLPDVTKWKLATLSETSSATIYTQKTTFILHFMIFSSPHLLQFQIAKPIPPPPHIAHISIRSFVPLEGM